MESVLSMRCAGKGTGPADGVKDWMKKTCGEMAGNARPTYLPVARGSSGEMCIFWLRDVHILAALDDT
jgi:hypothetical protein